MKGVNKVILLGNLGKDPELKNYNGKNVCHITIATSRFFKGKEGKNEKTETDWHRVVFFDKAADIISRYLRKGSKIYVEGYIKTRKVKDDSGKDKYFTDIVGTEFQMLDEKKERKENQDVFKFKHEENFGNVALEDDDLPF